MKSLVFRNSAETLSKTLAKSSSFFIHFAVFCVMSCAHDDYKNYQAQPTSKAAVGSKMS